MSSHLVFATPQATRAHFERLKSQGGTVMPSAVLGKTDLVVSRVGFGSYRIHEFEPDHREALRTALLAGVNLIDTSTNYTDGSSERMIGDVTNELITSGKIKREELVFVTKAGYVQGNNLKDAKARAAAGRPYPEMVEFQPDCWHNISPEFLEAQISSSLERLKITTIDVLLLHNPEYFLKSGGSREAYYQRIAKAFRHLESECGKGRIRAYGVSSNTIPVTDSRSDFTSVARLLDLAAQITPEHRFSVIQLPFNLFEAGGALHLNNNRQSVFEFAHKNKLGVLTNRPFNSYAKDHLVRLTSFPTHDEVVIKGGLHTVLGRAVELENSAPNTVPGKPVQGFQWAHLLRERLGDLDDLLAWRDALYQQILPSIRQALGRLDESSAAWSQDYQNAMRELLNLITHDLENLAEKKNQILADQLRLLAPDLAATATLSRKVLRIYEAFPELTCILVGMRTPAYVQDVVGLSEAPLAAEIGLETLRRLQRHRS